MSDGTAQPKRGFFWWLTAILAPIGIFGGPVALMNLVAGIVEWNGILGYIVNWWDVTIGEPCAALVQVFAAWIGWENVPAWFPDYFAAGIIFMTTICRAALLLGTINTRDLGDMLFLILIIPVLVLLWPMGLFYFIGSMFQPSTKIARQVDFLTLSPVAIFVALFIANFWA